MGTAAFVVLLLILFLIIGVRSKISAIGSLTEALKEELGELRQRVEELRAATEGVEVTRPSYRENEMPPDPGGIYAPHIARDEDMERAVQEALNETGATSEKQMGVVIKAARGKLRGKRFREAELDSLVHTHLKGKQ
jgi:YqeY-like protein